METGTVIFVVGQGDSPDYVLIKFDDTKAVKTGSMPRWLRIVMYWLVIFILLVFLGALGLRGLLVVGFVMYLGNLIFHPFRRSD